MQNTSVDRKPLYKIYIHDKIIYYIKYKIQYIYLIRYYLAWTTARLLMEISKINIIDIYQNNIDYIVYGPKSYRSKNYKQNMYINTYKNVQELYKNG